jgi:hypothetical protein
MAVDSDARKKLGGRGSKCRYRITRFLRWTNQESIHRLFVVTSQCQWCPITIHSIVVLLGEWDFVMSLLKRSIGWCLGQFVSVLRSHV